MIDDKIEAIVRQSQYWSDTQPYRKKSYELLLGESLISPNDINIGTTTYIIMDRCGITNDDLDNPDLVQQKINRYNNLEKLV